MTLQKLPPHDIEAERAVVAAGLVDTDVVRAVAPLVRPEDFFREKHGVVYGAQLALLARHEPTDPVMVMGELGRRGHLELVGGPAFLAELTTDLATTQGAEFWAETVARCAVYRRTIAVAGRIAQIAFEGPQDIEAATAEMLTLLRGATAYEGQTGPERATAILARSYDALVTRLTVPESRRGVATGWPSVDRMLYAGGLLPGWLYTWLAQTSIGKSTVGRTLLRNIALSGVECVLFTLEQSAEVSVEQILLGMAGINTHAVEAGGQVLAAAELAVLERSRERFMGSMHRLRVDGTAGIRPSQIHARIQRLRADGNPRVVVVDYLHRMRPDRDRGDDVKNYSEIVRALSDTAKELDVALILFAQISRQNLSRGSADRGVQEEDSRREDAYRPTIGDLKWTGDAENYANAILALHRRQWYVQRGYLSPKPGTEHDLEVLVLKQQLGPAGLCALLQFDGARGTVSDPDGWYAESTDRASVA